MSGKDSVVDSTTSKVWLVTGASRSLGRAIAEAALSKGHKVVSTARNPEHLKNLILEYSGQVQAVALDVTVKPLRVMPLALLSSRLEDWMCL